MSNATSLKRRFACIRKRTSASGPPPSSKSPTAGSPRTSRAMVCCRNVIPTASMAGSTAIRARDWPVSRSGPDAGASPFFPPRYPSNPTAQEALLHVLRRDPKLFGIPGTRWTLAKIRDVVDWLGTTTRAGICQLLHRLRISYKRGPDYVHSPDADYLAKLADIAVYLEQSRTSNGRIVTLYQDGPTYYRQPSPALAHAAPPHHQLPASGSPEPRDRDRKKWGDRALLIHLRPFPTCASWTNPMEKLWRKPKQEELHLHRPADRLDELRQRVCTFLDQFGHGSLDLL